MKKFSQEFKKVAVEKFLARGNRPIDLVCVELGVASQTLYRWAQDFGKDNSMTQDEKRPQDRNSAEKFKAVMQFNSLGELDQGLFLRREGLKSEHLQTWHQQMQDGLDQKKMENSSRQQLLELNREVRDLKKDLLRKTVALAETAALLVLKKKADLIWGSATEE